jgi:transaldolase/glucose-6-phosphate isomerase
VNPLKALHRHGQAVWLDFLSRRFVAEGGLQKLVAQDDLTGVTSNPAIFKKAIAGSSDYDSSLAAAVKDADSEVMSLYEGLAIEDIQHAADTLKATYLATARADGFVSLEVSPYLANDTEETIAEGPCDRRRFACHPSAHFRRHQYQHHAAVLARGLS